MTRRDLRVATITALAVVALLIGSAAYLLLRPAIMTSGGGTAFSSPPGHCEDDAATQTPDRCEADPADVAAIIAMSAEETLECFGGRSITFLAYASSMVGIGTCPNAFIAGEGWLNPCGAQARMMAAHPGDDETLAAVFPPGMTSADVPIETWVEVTGHFDDPAALFCKGVGGNHDAEIVAICRAMFVLERAVPIGSD